MPDTRAALYLRLSRDDERAGESMSIENQRDYLRRYVLGRGWQVAGIYTDDGWPGTSFRRPAFRRLLGDIEAGRIDVVVTKDLSRLGRDQIGTAYYYQIYFPGHRVRYIAVSEGFDTAERGGTSALFPFLTAANEFYTADISRKVRAALTTRKREGKFIGAVPPLGYRRDPEDRGRLCPEPEGAATVQALFRQFLLCGSVSETVRWLMQAGCPTPAHQRRGERGGTWSDTMVRRILTNPTYAGHLTQNRREKVNYKSERRVDLPREAWITVENTHPALVSPGDFDRAGELLALHGCGGAGEDRPLSGLVFCGDCGSPMVRCTGGAGAALVCRGSRRGSCSPHRVGEAALLHLVCGELRKLAPWVPPELRPLLDRPGRALLTALVQAVRVGGDGGTVLEYRFPRPGLVPEGEND